MKVLIVDDSERDRKYLRLNLEHHGIDSILEASDGQEGLNLAKSEKPDLIISDALMPNIDGFQFLRIIKQDEVLRSIPFIFYSSVYTGHKEEELAISLGAEAFIVKPKEPEELWNEIIKSISDNKSKKNLKPAGSIENGDEYFIQKYNHIIVSKLEEKVYQLNIEIVKNKEAEESLKQSEQRFRELFEEAPVGYHEIDKNGIITKMNNTELKMLQYEKKEMLNHYIWEFVIESEICKTSLAKKFNGIFDNTKSYENTFRRKDGSIFTGLLEDIFLKDNKGEITGIRTTLQDISERIKNETALHESNIRLEETLTELRETQKMVLQQERMRALGQMASGIAHDINNSLSPIIAYSDLFLSDTTINEKVKKGLSLIRMAGLDIVKTIERMKEFYRPRAEQDEFGRIDLNKIILSTIDLTRHKWKDMAEQQGNVIKIETSFQNDLPIIQGHESELREAFTNLIINAVDAMPKGGSIILKSYPSFENLIFEIQDTGFGMDKDTLEHCLDPFYTTKGEKGTGLGLSMVFGIMQRHQGKIEVQSQLGKGTIIKLYFPNRNISVGKITNVENEILPSLKILCIDDNENIREMLSILFQKINHKVKFAESGKSGLEMFFSAIDNDEPYDVVITDLGMPYMDGNSVAESIKGQFPQTPVILMTGWGAFLEENIMESVDYILKKPLLIDELNRALKTVLKIQ